MPLIKKMQFNFYGKILILKGKFIILRFSFWKIEYEKYTGEGEKLYMTRNLAAGFLQRLETFRKYSFGTWGVYGDEPNLEIRGIL